MFLINPYILQASGNPLWDGLQAYYTADNTPNDALGNYNGTLTNGATYGTGIISNGFSLDGVNDYVDFGNNLDFDGSTAFSLSAWIYSNDVTNLTTVLSKNASLVGYEMDTFNTKARFYLFNNGSTNYLAVENSAVLSINTWYNIVVTYDGSKTVAGTKIYVNANLNTQVTVRDTLTGSSSNVGNFIIGSRSGSTLFQNGIVDEVGVWNVELTASQVTELYNSGAAKQYPN